jgi:predicted aminopeptidase
VLDRLRRDFAQLRHRSEHYTPYAPWFATRLNNAKLNSVATYYDLVPAFDRLLATHRGKLEPFYESVRELTRLSEEERHAHLATLHQGLATLR